jgi:NAD+ synthase
VPAAEAAAVLELTAEQVGRIYKDIEAKRRATRYLHANALLVDPVDEV